MATLLFAYICVPLRRKQFWLHLTAPPVGYTLTNTAPPTYRAELLRNVLRPTNSTVVPHSPAAAYKTVMLEGKESNPL